MAGTIYVINPNSTKSITKRIDAAIAPLRSSDGPVIASLTLAAGPPGIQSQRDADGIILPLLKFAATIEDQAAAFVIACFGDPGMHALREQSAKPVLGISECGVLTALSMGQRFGVIATQADAVPRHLRYFAAMGVTGRLAADLPIGRNVAELADQDRTIERMIEVGLTLRDQHGADVILLGGGPMTHCRKPLQDAVGIPVVDPTPAAVTMAIGRVRLGWHTREDEPVAKSKDVR